MNRLYLQNFFLGGELREIPCIEHYFSASHFHKNGPVAQWIEQQPSKLWVERSSRSGVTVLFSQIIIRLPV